MSTGRSKFFILKLKNFNFCKICLRPVVALSPLFSALLIPLHEKFWNLVWRILEGTRKYPIIIFLSNPIIKNLLFLRIFHLYTICDPSTCRFLRSTQDIFEQSITIQKQYFKAFLNHSTSKANQIIRKQVLVNFQNESEWVTWKIFVGPINDITAFFSNISEKFLTVSAGRFWLKICLQADQNFLFWNLKISTSAKSACDR